MAGGLISKQSTDASATSSSPAAAPTALAEPVPLRSRIGLWLGAGLFVFILLFVDLDPANPLVTRMFAVLVAAWWMTECDRLRFRSCTYNEDGMGGALVGYPGRHSSDTVRVHGRASVLRFAGGHA